MSISMIDLISAKKRGIPHTKEEIGFIVRGICDGSLPDYQLSAWLMAVCFRGMEQSELTDFTLAMAASGKTADLSAIEGVIADKHSTGGVGDKTTLVIAPLAASCGLKIAKMAGRGLGHTGGTIDKLESIPGLSTSFTSERFAEIVNTHGLCVGSQSEGMNPADKKLYALRDVTATVDSLPLIASSVMSKKLAGGADIIILDVKCGSGSFMKTKQDAVALAETMVNIGKQAGKHTVALITNMDIPLGNSVGNLIEVKEAVEVLNGKGSADLRELCIEITAQMLVCTGTARERAIETVTAELDSGRALHKLAAMVAAQGGNSGWILDTSLIPSAPFSVRLCSPRSGIITAIDTETVGLAAMRSGAGREVLSDRIDPAAGIIFSKKRGDAVEKGECIATIFAAEQPKLSAAYELLQKAIEIGDNAVKPQPLIYDIVT